MVIYPNIKLYFTGIRVYTKPSKPKIHLTSYIGEKSMSFLKQRLFLVERSKASVRLEIAAAIKAQKITIGHVVVDEKTPLPLYDFRDNWNSPEYIID